MGRQEKTRSVEFPPQNFRFRPESEKSDYAAGETSVTLRLDEFEAIRLTDKIGYDHTQASKIMGISRPTFTKLVSRARGKVAELIIDGKPLEISGGSILFSEDVYCCKICRRPFKRIDEAALVCPVCSNTNIIKARSECNGNCRCCEEDGECD